MQLTITLTMVSCKAVDDIDVIPEGILVVTATQPRAYLTPPTPNTRDIIFAEEQVLWAYFTRHLDTLLLGKTDYRNLEEVGERERRGLVLLSLGFVIKM